MSEEELEDIELANRTQRTLEFIYSTIKEKGEISQFKEDVLCVITELLERLKQQNKVTLTATEIVAKNYTTYIQKERENHLENTILNQQNRIDKAIEYMEKRHINVDEDSNYYEYWITDRDTKKILQILRGEDENK